MKSKLRTNSVEVGDVMVFYLGDKITNEYQLLSMNNEKIKVYEDDPYYRDCMDDITSYFDKDIIHKFHNIAPVIFRPDSIITGHCFNVLDKIIAQGFRPIYISPFEYCRFKVRECWKYQLNIATRDRIDVMDMLLIGFPCLYVIMYKDFSNDVVSATNHLSRCKGPSIPENRKPNHLRYSDKSAQVSVLTYIHISDEPIDIIREMGAFFSRDQRMKIIESIINPTYVDINYYLRALADCYESHTFKYEDVRRKVETDSSINRKKELIDAFNRLENKEISWRNMKKIMEQNRDIYSYWDIVSVCAQFAKTHYQNKNPIIKDVL